MMITKLFYLAYLEKLLPKNFKQKLRHQEVEAEVLRMEAIQKLPIPHSWPLECFIISPFLKLKMLGVSSDRI